MSLQALEKVEKIFLDTNFANLFAFPGMFKAQAAIFELKTDKFAKWFDSLGLPLVDNLWINAANMETDKQEIYSIKEFKEYGYGELISRSIAIPAFIDKGKFADGGLYDNPCLTQWKDGLDIPIFVSQLMMPYRTTPKGRIEKLSYTWDVKAFQCFQYQKANFPNITTIYPDDGENSSLDFGMSREKKKNMINMAYKMTMAQLSHFGIKADGPTPIALALSGGGIRSGSHIGVVRALMENGFIPVKWSGTSGGAAFATLMAAAFAEINVPQQHDK